MKRWMALAVALMLTLTACGAKPTAEQPTLKSDVTLESMATLVTDQIPLAMPTPLTREMLGDLLSLGDDEVAEFAGQITLSMVSADQLILIKAKPDKLDQVIEALEARVELTRQTFQDYLPQEAAKAEAGRVVTRGNYVFLIMLSTGDGDEADPTAAVDLAEELLMDCFA